MHIKDTMIGYKEYTIRNGKLLVGRIKIFLDKFIKRKFQLVRENFQYKHNKLMKI